MWKLCEDTEDHANCQNYTKWKYLHNQEFEKICQESNASCKSLYVPGETNVIIIVKSVLIGVGIKSLDPPCLGKACPFGPHPYTCDVCLNQRVDLKDVLNKRKKSRLIPGKSPLGVCGFRKSYASKSETEVKSEELNAENVSLKRENRSLRGLYLDKKCWGEMLTDACNTANEEKLVIDLLGLVNQPKTLQFEVPKNLIGKMKSKTNHRYTSIIKDISALHKNRLGQTNYSLLQDLLDPYGKTTASLHASLDGLEIGINLKVIDQAVQIYNKRPVIECSDEACTLRFISPCKMSGVVELVGECWGADINNWKSCRRQIPRKDAESQDDFSALKRYILDVVHEDKLAKSTAIHNLAALSGLGSTPLIYLIWPTPNKGYGSVHLLKVWDHLRLNCFYDEENNLRQEPVLLMGHAADSAGFQLAAASSLMSPSPYLLNLGVLSLTLGVGESAYSAPYLGYLPSIAYLDYDHEMRLFLKCLKYPTLDLTMWPGECPVIVTIEHLKELQSICLKDRCDIPFADKDLLFTRYLDQNCDAALRILNREVADLLDSHVISSNGTTLYIRTVADLMNPFLQPCSNPNKMQKYTSKGITIFQLWRKMLELKKMRLHSGKNTYQFPEKRGKFITVGCFKTAEILFAAATNHMLAMFSHFKALGPENSSPYKSGTKTTERVISELQGKTTQIQSLDAQPTVSDILNRVSIVQFNQLAEDRLIKNGAKKQASTNRKRLSRSEKTVEKETYQYLKLFSEFLDQQRDSYNEGIIEGKELFEKYCEAGASYLKKKDSWNFLGKKESVLPSQNQFTGSLPVGYGAHKLLNVQSHKLLADMSSLEEEKLHDDILFESDIDDEQKMFPEEFCDSDNANDIKLKKEQRFRNMNNREWYVSRALNDRITYLHIKRAINIIIPREYVSRERSRRHIASNYLPGLEPINSDHNVQKYRFYAFKLSSGYHLGKITFLEDQGNPVVSSNSANAHVTFRALYLVNKERTNLHILAH